MQEKYTARRASAPFGSARNDGNPDADARFGRQQFLMVPLALIDEMEPGDLAVYLKLLRVARAVPHKAEIVDKRTGEIVDEVPLGAWEVFVSQEQIGRWRNSADQVEHADVGYKCVRRLKAKGLVRKIENAKKAKRGYSRDVLYLPLAAVHCTGRPGRPDADPHETRVDTGRNAAAEKLCNDRASVGLVGSADGSTGWPSSERDRASVGGTERLSTFAKTRVDTGPDACSATPRASLSQITDSCTSGVCGQTDGMEPTPPVVQHPSASHVPRVADSQPDGTPWTAEQRAVLEANVAKVRRLRGLPVEELHDVETVPDPDEWQAGLDAGDPERVGGRKAA